MKSNTFHPIRASRISYDLKDPLTHGRAIAEIVKALTEVHGNVVHAAAVLEVSYRQLRRWIGSFPELQAQLEAIRFRFGHTHGLRDSDLTDDADADADA